MELREAVANPTTALEDRRELMPEAIKETPRGMRMGAMEGTKKDTAIAAAPRKSLRMPPNESAIGLG